MISLIVTCSTRSAALIAQAASISRQKTLPTPEYPAAGFAVCERHHVLKKTPHDIAVKHVKLYYYRK